ncbi:MAG: histidinol-phosphate transaminase [Saprospiraceae bacterium]
MEIQKLVRLNIRNLKPYSSARSEFVGTAAVMLDANENGHDLSGEGLNRYPGPLQHAVKARLSALKSVPAESIFTGNGSDEAIDLLFRIFCEPGHDEAVICPPTYGMYEVLAAIHRTPLKKVPLDAGFGLRPEAIFAAVTRRTKLLFLCSPNNPSGNLADPEAVALLLRKFPGIVVVDEAYIDFAEQKSWSLQLPEFPNLVVLQTLSKAWALAGARFGMAFASPQITGLFDKVKYPYNVNMLTQRKVLEALAEPEKTHAAVVNILAEKSRLREALLKFSFVKTVYPGDANFLLVKFEDARAVFEHLKRQSIVVRDRSGELHCGNCLRITIGTKSENVRMVEALAGFNGSLGLES